MSRLARLIAPMVLVHLAWAAAAAAAPTARSGARPLDQALESIIGNGAMARSSVSMRVIEADTGRVIFDHLSGTPLKPASNMKLMTSAASLAALRPEYVFPTVFSCLNRPSGTVIRGDLYIKGYGSPRLVGEQWWLMAREIRARGIRTIEGDLVGDDTYFDDRDRPEGWPPPTEDAFYNAPVSALSADFNAITVVVRPAAPGQAPEVTLVPYSSFFNVVNRAVTGGTTSRLRVGRHLEGDQNVIVVDGSISRDSSPSLSYRSVERPTFYALAAFREAAAKEGIEIRGVNRRGRVPDGTYKIYEHESPPLAELVGTLNKLSNNYMAESLLKTLGAESYGAPGTTDKGARAVLTFLEGLGVDTRQIVIRDGSGLSHENRLTAASLASVLLAMYKDFESSPEFMASLAIGGVDGTLDRRMRGAPAQRNIRAKTGYLNGVSSLSGYAYNAEKKLLVFSILVNAGRTVDTAKVQQGIDRLCSALVESKLPEGLSNASSP